MKHISPDEHEEIIRKLTQKALNLYNDESKTWYENRIAVSDLWVLHFIGTQYQERYLDHLIGHLLQGILIKCE